MKFYIPVKLLALIEVCLVVMLSITAIMLGNNFREERLNTLISRGEALAQTILLEIEKEKPQEEALVLEHITTLQSTLTWLYHEKPALEIAHIAVVTKD